MGNTELSTRLFGKKAKKEIKVLMPNCASYKHYKKHGTVNLYDDNSNHIGYVMEGGFEGGYNAILVAF